MSLTAAVLIADSELSDDVFASLGLSPSGEDLAVSDILLTPSDERVCVVRSNGFTVLADGSMEVLGQFEADATSLPGRVIAAIVVGSVSYAMLRVFEDGRLVRHLECSEGEITDDEGVPLSEESAFVVDEDGCREVDGDLLIEYLTSLAGIPGSPELFDLTGRACSSSSAAEAGSPDLPAQDAAPQEGDVKDARKGFFRRLFG